MASWDEVAWREAVRSEEAASERKEAPQKGNVHSLLNHLGKLLDTTY